MNKVSEKLASHAHLWTCKMVDEKYRTTIMSFIDKVVDPYSYIGGSN
jgi:hypothetical protein